MITKEAFRAVDDNGEVILEIKEGTKIFTPEEQAAYAERLRKRERPFLVRKASIGLGNFIFVLSDDAFNELSPINVTRLIYLATFLDYNNQLMLTERRKMKQGDLAEVLGVSSSTVRRFLEKVSPHYLDIDTTDGSIIVNDHVFIKGSIGKNKSRSYRKIYIDSFKNLYKNSSKNQHIFIGYIFKFLKYINIEHNALCYNVNERDIHKIDYMNFGEMFGIIGVDKSRISNFLKKYKELCFEINEKKENLCFFSSDTKSKCNKNLKIFINPNILYSGTDYTFVNILVNFIKTI